MNCSWQLCAHSLAAYLNHHGVQTKHFAFSGVLEALCSSEKREREGIPFTALQCTSSPRINPVWMQPQGCAHPCLRGCRLWLGLDTWIPSLIPVLWRVRKCLCASSRGCGGGSFSGIGSTSISPCRQCNVQPFLLCESKLFFG